VGLVSCPETRSTPKTYWVGVLVVFSPKVRVILTKIKIVSSLVLTIIVSSCYPRGNEMTITAQYNFRRATAEVCLPYLRGLSEKEALDRPYIYPFPSRLEPFMRIMHIKPHSVGGLTGVDIGLLNNSVGKTCVIAANPDYPEYYRPITLELAASLHASLMYDQESRTEHRRTYCSPGSNDLNYFLTESIFHHPRYGAPYDLLVSTTRDRSIACDRPMRLYP
jgi:hypothetical protein